jgi:hypothetical protein
MGYEYRRGHFGILLKVLRTFSFIPEIQTFASKALFAMFGFAEDELR